MHAKKNRSRLHKAGLFLGGVLIALPLVSSAKPTTMIFNAINHQDTAALQQLLQDKSNLEVRNAQGQTPLMTVTYQGNQELAIQLIEMGADVNAQDNIANSPFLYAGAEGMLDIVKVSLEHGADFTVYNRYGGTALIPAAEKGHLDVVKLLAFTPDYPIDHVNRLGWTALMEAVVLGDGGSTQTEIVKTLLEAGADATIPDKNGVSALSHAQQRGFNEIVTLLQAHTKP